MPKCHLPADNRTILLLFIPGAIHRSRMFPAQNGLNYFFFQRKSKFYHQVGNTACCLLSLNCEMCWKIKTLIKVVFSMPIPCRKVTPFQNTAFLVCLYLLSHFSYNSLYLTNFNNIFHIFADVTATHSRALQSRIKLYSIFCVSKKVGNTKSTSLKVVFPD